MTQEAENTFTSRVLKTHNQNLTRKILAALLRLIIIIYVNENTPRPLSES